MNTISEIIAKKLYVGDFESSSNLEELKKYSIKNIVSLCEDKPEKKYDNFEYFHFKVIDVEDFEIVDIFEKVNKIIDKGFTLLHCEKGISRSCAFAISYLLSRKHENMDYDEALKFVARRRRCCMINKGFEKQIISVYE